uniref:Uncharacterized protein n=1 Tax=Anguilla anguilla TaxID=7936 RepID=A0A0E9S2X1_ANGAN
MHICVLGIYLKNQNLQKDKAMCVLQTVSHTPTHRQTPDFIHS